MDNKNIAWLQKTLGPGLIFASMAIGVSHLVQSTRAGANYGFGLLIFVILANLLKYPFFEFTSRYANSTGTSIIEGYKELGKPVLWIYFIVTLVSMFFISSAVGAVTTGFLQNLFNTSKYGFWNHFFILVICTSILAFGKYNLFDKVIKVIALSLLLSTICAFFLVILKGPQNEILFPQIEYNKTDIFFIIALMGWMPTAVDLSSWNSLWTLERIKQTGFKPSLKQTLFEFNMGYIISAALAVCFLTLGSYLMYGTGTSFSNNSSIFANQVIKLYTDSIGNWSYWVISISGFSIMFGTCIAVFDGYARSVSECIRLVDQNKKNNRLYYDIIIWILATGTFGIIYLFGSRLKELVDLATTISFIIAPFVAIANYKLVSNLYLKPNDIPPDWLKYLAITGIVFLSGFSILFLYVRII
ncbi:MAG: iron transporter [Candidatus Marinimicrobia bacterium]|nr:iron transporter [Candidatus Neomarinimicrobiota bacterium]